MAITQRSLYLIDFVVGSLMTVVLGFLFTAMLITGVVYPIRPAEQQLLRTWGVEAIFIPIMWLEYLLPLAVATIATAVIIRKVKDKGIWALILTGMIGGVTGLTNGSLGLYNAPIVVKTMVTYPLIGLFLGQYTGKLAVILIKMRTKR